MKKTFEEMKVMELKEESRKRGLTLEHKGHKFTKQELIQRIRAYDAEQEDIEGAQKVIEEAGQTEDNEDFVEEATEVKEAEAKEESGDYIVFAKTLEEIEQKYGSRKKQTIYDNELKVGSFVVFVHYVEALNGHIYKKLRTAKVVGINRRKELVRVITLLGVEKELTFNELLYIRGSAKDCSYPRDIKTYLREQRTEKGKVLINERFAKSNVID